MYTVIFSRTVNPYTLIKRIKNWKDRNCCLCFLFKTHKIQKLKNDKIILNAEHEVWCSVMFSIIILASFKCQNEKNVELRYIKYIHDDYLYRDIIP